jgi:hypothetical protein
MNREEYEHQTLGELLISTFFLDNNRPFTIIYDSLDMLEDFFTTTMQAQLVNEFRFLSIQASPSPAEFLERQVIADDFDDEIGWYRHRWIIHVHGEHADDVSRARSFYYYELLGEAFVLGDFIDLLMHPAIKLVKVRETEAVLNGYPNLNRQALKYLVDLPLSCFVSLSGAFSEPLAWLLLFTSSATLNPSQMPKSPSWDALISTRAPCTHANVLLELLYQVHPLNAPQLDDETVKAITSYFSAMIANLAIDGVSLSGDWLETLTKIVRFAFQQARPVVKVKPTPKKKSSLDAYRSEPEASKTMQLFQGLVEDWIVNADETLALRFQQWTYFLRKQQSPAGDSIAINETTLVEQVSQFAFTGMVDISLATYLLAEQERLSMDDQSWMAKLDEIIKKRKTLWDKVTRVWWSQRKFFSTLAKDHGLSMKDFWQFVRQAGRFLSCDVPENVIWANTANMAWDIEATHVAINNPEIQYLFTGEEYFTPFSKLVEKIDSAYQEYNKRLNNAFCAHYIDRLSESRTTFYDNFNEAVWSPAIAALSNENPIGFVFCDAMRKDLASEVIDELTRKLQESKGEIRSNSVTRIETCGILPSITNLGWNLALSNGNVVKARLSGDKLISGILDGNGDLKILDNPEARESRIAELFANAGQSIMIQRVNPATVKVDIDVLREKREEGPDPVVPVVWFDRFDDHDLLIGDFIPQKAGLLSEIVEIIFKLHEVGIKDIYMLVDHGFIFTSNTYLLDSLPDSLGALHKRHCISTHAFPGDNDIDYPDWQIIPVEQFPFEIEQCDPAIQSIIFPRGDALFKRGKNEGPFFVHGGLSFQECDLIHIASHCEFKPSVEIESIEAFDQGEPLVVSGKETYYLKEIPGEVSSTFQIQVQARKKAEKGEQLRPLTFKVTPEDRRIKVDPDKECTLEAGKLRRFTFYIDHSVNISSIVVCIKNQAKELIKKKEFHLQPPSVYGDVSFD